MTMALSWGILAVAVIWRCYHLNSFPGLDPDEVEGALAWFRDSPLLWYVYPSGRPHLNPLAPLLLWPFAALAEPAAWVVRMPAVLTGLAVLPATFVLVRTAFSPAAALPATLLTASAPFLIAYSRQGWDLAYVPVVTALSVGFAYQRRPVLAAACTALLALIHPTAAFVLVLVAAPFVVDLWRRVEGTPHQQRRRVLLVAGCVVVYGGLFTVLSGFSAEIAVRLEHAPDLARLVATRLFAVGLLDHFLSAFWHAFTGPMVFAEFLGSPVSAARLWPGLARGLVWIVGVRVLWRQQHLNELTLLVALPFALLAQYLTLGTPDLLVPWKERYFLWAMVPSCWAVVFVLQGVGARWGAPKAVRPVVLILSAIWLLSFHTGYLRPYAQHGGLSASLDYRAAAVQPKAQVLDVIARHRSATTDVVTLFAGEGRLHLGLMYLSSGDSSVSIRNLGRVLYQTQQDDRDHLTRLFDAGAQDVFFVDYAWDDLRGGVREIHADAARPVPPIVAPWTPEALEDIRTADGYPLLRVWRLR